MTDFLPELPEGYHWQLITEDRRDCTAEYMAEPDAVEARLWCDNGDAVVVLKRTGDFGYWGPNGVGGEGGLRKWVIEGQAPQGLYDWEQFETLSQITHRIDLPTEENA
jgi:hypothetical protein